MIFERAQGKTNVASPVERTKRFAVLLRNNDRSTTIITVVCVIAGYAVSETLAAQCQH